MKNKLEDTVVKFVEREVNGLHERIKRLEYENEFLRQVNKELIELLKQKKTENEIN